MVKTAPKQSGWARYMEIATVLQREIAAGIWSDGDKLPSIKLLAERFGVAPLTARQAIKYLEGRGIVECRAGAGTYVSGPLLKLQMFRLNQDFEQVVEQVSLGNLTNIEPPAIAKAPDIPRRLQKAPRYVRFNRLFTLDGQPALLSKTYLDQSIYDEDPETYERQPLLPQVMKNGQRKLQRSSLIMTIEPANLDEARYLNTPPFASVAKLKLILTDESETAVYLGNLIFPADLVRVEF